mmetsp:Transcript_60850/g.188400  ORF Transcript_60850/g.188400 Transcript_60850/m.188400 type:complete len:89 (+) Transcript_60850:169-435(+)
MQNPVGHWRGQGGVPPHERMACGERGERGFAESRLQPMGVEPIFKEWMIITISGISSSSGISTNSSNKKKTAASTCETCLALKISRRT